MSQKQETRKEKVIASLKTSLAELMSIFASIIATLKAEYQTAVFNFGETEANDSKALVSGLVDAASELDSIKRSFYDIERSIVERSILYFLCGIYNASAVKVSGAVLKRLAIPVQALFHGRNLGLTTTSTALALVKAVREFAESDKSNKKTQEKLIARIAKALGSPMSTYTLSDGRTFNTTSYDLRFLAGRKSREFVEAFRAMVKDWNSENDNARTVLIEQTIEAGVVETVQGRADKMRAASKPDKSEQAPATTARTPRIRKASEQAPVPVAQSATSETVQQQIAA